VQEEHEKMLANAARGFASIKQDRIYTEPEVLPAEPTPTSPRDVSFVRSPAAVPILRPQVLYPSFHTVCLISATPGHGEFYGNCALALRLSERKRRPGTSTKR
jgi:hypothetical protein